MKTISNRLLANCHYIFFFIFFIIGLLIYKDYGFNIDETFQRRSGFYWLNYLSNFFGLDKISLISSQKLNTSINFTEPWSDVYGIIFDVPVAIIEIIFSINEPLKIYEMRHFLTFIYFFVGIVFFYKILINRFDSKFLSLFGCLMLIITPRIFGDSFQNNKDIIFLAFFIISIFCGFKVFESYNLKNIIYFGVFSSIATSTRLFGLVFPASFLLIYLFMTLGNKKDLKLFKKISFYFLVYIFFLILHWPYLWSGPINNFLNFLNSVGNFGPGNVLFNGIFYNPKLVPYSYLSTWIVISTPILNLLMFFCGFLILSKFYLNKLLNVDVRKKTYDFWENINEKKDFYILILFVILFFAGSFFQVKHYNSWRMFYFLNFFIIYFSIFFINFSKSKVNKKKQKYLSLILIAFIFLNIIKLFQYHPYQSIYFNQFTSKKFIEGFEVDYTGLSGIEFLRYVVNDNSNNKKIKIGINSWYPLWRMAELLPEKDRKRLIFLSNKNKENADYIYSNRIYDVNIYLDDKYNLSRNFEKQKQLMIDGALVYEIYKRKGL